MARSDLGVSTRQLDCKRMHGTMVSPQYSVVFDSDFFIAPLMERGE